MTQRKTITLSDKQWEQLEAESKRLGITQTGAIRYIIELYFYNKKEN